MACARPSDAGVLRPSGGRARRMDHRAGLSLFELVVTIAVLGVVTTVVGLSWRSQPPARDTDSAAAVIAAGRRQSLHTGRSVTLHVEVNDTVHVITVAPDGRIHGGEPLGFESLAGRPLQFVGAEIAARSRRGTFPPDAHE
jgi:type II secretory pathway pseudopilin PulG